MMEINVRDRYPDQLGSTNGIDLQLSTFTSRPLAADRAVASVFSLP
jgi:hypothetical protein